MWDPTKQILNEIPWIDPAQSFPLFMYTAYIKL